MKKLLISCATLALAITAMSTTTYAWYTMSSTASINDFDLNISGGDGIVLSTDNVEFSETITITPGSAFLLKPVTTLDGTNFKSQSGGVEADGYFATTIYAKTNSSENVNIYLEETSNITGSDKQFTPLKKFTITNGENKEYGPGSDNSTIAVNPANAAYYSIQGVNEASQALYSGVIAPTPTGNDLGGLANQVTVQNASDLTKYASIAYYNAIMSTKITRESLPTAAPTTYTTQQVISSVKAGETSTTIIIRVWLDGWDADCFDAVMSNKITTKIVFTTDIDKAKTVQ